MVDPNGNLTDEQKAALAIADAEKKAAEDKDKKPPVDKGETREDLLKRVEAAEKRAKDNLLEENKGYQDLLLETRQDRTKWDEEREALEARIEELAEGDKKPKDGEDEEPDITQDVDAWKAWNRKSIRSEMESLMDERLKTAEEEKNKKVKEATLQDQEVADYAAYINKFHPDKVDEIQRKGISPEIQTEINHWRQKADADGIRDIVKAREFDELLHPDEKVQEDKLLKKLMERRATLTQDGVKDIREPVLSGKTLRGASWTDVAKRAAKRMEGVEDLDL